MRATDLPAVKTPFIRVAQAQSDGHGAECWSARGLHPLLGYSPLRRFEQTIHRAKASCATSGIDPERHCAGTGKPITGGKGANQREN